MRFYPTRELRIVLPPSAQSPILKLTLSLSSEQDLKQTSHKSFYKSHGKIGCALASARIGLNKRGVQSQEGPWLSVLLVTGSIPSTSS